MPLTDKDRRIAYSIVRHLQSQVERGHLDDDAAEGILVAQQCLCEAYGVDPSVPDHRAKYEVRESLEELFEKMSVGSESSEQPSAQAAPSSKQVSDEVKEKAEAYKQQGNTHLKLNKYNEAVECYSKAIDLDPSNATYFCNRAAAFIKISQLQKALDDCNKAVSLNPSYARAYGRLGYVYSLMNKLEDSRDCFKKAIELDPENDSYKSNLETVVQQLKSDKPPSGAESGASQGATAAGGQQQQQQQLPQFPPRGFPGMGGIASMMQNPAFMNMATSLMSNPAFQDFAGRMMSQGQVPNPGNIADMMPNIAQTAQDMQRSNPEAFENLRQQASQFASGMGQPPPSQDSQQDKSQQ